MFNLKSQFIRWLPFILAGLLLFALHVAIAGGPSSPLSTERFYGPDSYSRLLRVQELQQGGPWYLDTYPRSNAPFGEAQHSTRPFDVLLLAGAWFLSLFVGAEGGLFWWAMFVSPVLHLVAGFALAWTAAPLLIRPAKAWVIGLFAMQFGVLQYSIAGRPDHHTLLFLVFILVIGATVRALANPGKPKWALAAGAATGFGLWLSTEYLVVLAAILFCLLLSWLRAGNTRDLSHARLWVGLWYGLGLLVLATVGTIAERPFSGFLDPEYDRISIVHIVLAALIFGFWAANLWLSRRDVTRDDQIAQWIAALSTGAIVLGAMYQIFPKFFLGPTVEMNPEIAQVFLSTVTEMRSAFAWHSATHFWLHKGIILVFALFGVPFLALQLYRERHAAVWDSWVLIAVILVLFTLLGLAFSRFMPYAGIILTIATAGSIAQLLAAATRKGAALAYAFAGILVAAIVGHAAFSAKAENAAMAGVSKCRTGIGELARYLEDPRLVRATPEIILAQPDMGPELLFRTRHDVVATPSHRNPGVVAFVKSVGSEDEAVAKKILFERKVSLLILCRSMPVDPNTSRSILYFNLLNGVLPDWLIPLRLPIHIGIDYSVFRVRSSD